MNTALTFAVDLVRDPVATLYAAQDEDATFPALQLTAAGIVCASLASPAPFPTALVLQGLFYALAVFLIWLAGWITGGSGSPGAIARVVGVSLLPVAAVKMITALVGFPFIGAFFALYVNYLVIKIGHAFSTMADVVFTWVVLNVVSWLAMGVALAAVARHAV